MYVKSGGLFLLLNHRITENTESVFFITDILLFCGIKSNIANRSHKTVNSISRYENPEREADYDTLIRFADYFNVSLDYLLGRTDKEI